MKNLGLVRVGTAVPDLKVANTEYNADRIIALLKDGEEKGAGFLLFPELAITGYSCGDLFYQEHLYQSQLEALDKICRTTSAMKVTAILGCYLRIENNLYNCAAVIQKGRIKGLVPKMFLPNSKEFYEARRFCQCCSGALSRAWQCAQRQRSSFNYRSVV